MPEYRLDFNNENIKYLKAELHVSLFVNLDMDILNGINNRISVKVK